MNMIFFYIVTQYSLGEVFRHFTGPCCFRNVGKRLADNTALHSRRVFATLATVRIWILTRLLMACLTSLFIAQV